MPTEVLTALISASAAVLTAVVALLLDHRAFTMLDNRIGDNNRRIDDTNRRFDARLDDFSHRFDDTNRRFEDMNKRIDDTNRRIDDFKAEMVRRLERIEADLKEFFKVLAEHYKRIQRLEDKP